MANIETWRLRVATNVRVTQPEHVGLIAQLCSDAEDRGDNPAVWHHAAAFYGNAPKCPCCACSKARAA